MPRIPVSQQRVSPTSASPRRLNTRMTIGADSAGSGLIRAGQQLGQVAERRRLEEEREAREREAIIKQGNDIDDRLTQNRFNNSSLKVYNDEVSAWMDGAELTRDDTGEYTLTFNGETFDEMFQRQRDNADIEIESLRGEMNDPQSPMLVEQSNAWQTRLSNLQVAAVKKITAARADRIAQNYQETKDEALKRVRTEGNVTEVYDSIVPIIDNMPGWTVEQKAAELDALANKVAINGFEHQLSKSPHKALAHLKDEDSPIRQMMNADDLTRAMRTAETRIAQLDKANVEKKRNEFGPRESSIVGRLENRQDVTDEEVRQLHQDLLDDGRPEKAKEFLTRVKAFRQAHDVMDSLDGLPLSEQAVKIGEYKAATGDNRFSPAMAAALERMHTAMMTQARKAPVAYVSDVYAAELQGLEGKQRTDELRRLTRKEFGEGAFIDEREINVLNEMFNSGDIEGSRNVINQMVHRYAGTDMTGDGVIDSYDFSTVKLIADRVNKEYPGEERNIGGALVLGHFLPGHASEIFHNAMSPNAMDAFGITQEARQSAYKKVRAKLGGFLNLHQSAGDMSTHAVNGMVDAAVRHLLVTGQGSVSDDTASILDGIKDSVVTIELDTDSVNVPRQLIDAQGNTVTIDEDDEGQFRDNLESVADLYKNHVDYNHTFGISPDQVEDVMLLGRKRAFETKSYKTSYVYSSVGGRSGMYLRIKSGHFDTYAKDDTGEYLVFPTEHATNPNIVAEMRHEGW